MKRPPEWSHRRLVYLASGLLFASVLLRSLLTFGGNPVIRPILGLLAAWLLLFAGESVAWTRWPRVFAWRFPLYLLLQSIALLALLFLTDYSDYFPLLFGILSMQIAERFAPRITAAAVGLLSLMPVVPLLRIHAPSDAIALASIYAAVNVLLAFYVLTSRRAEMARQQNQALAQQLQETNRRLQSYSEELGQLAAARERQRLARELHDSVTQTVFSMTLTTQSAALLLERDPGRAGQQLSRLVDLAENALSEMRVLITELGPDKAAQGRLSVQLRRHLQDRRLPENISISLETLGSQPLSPAEEQNLFRIAQEAVNNIVKHAGPCHACIRLHLAEPFSLEIQDDGCGFDPERTGNGERVGLASMRERAAEIGWSLDISTGPGWGTRIRVEKPAGERKG
ncbi:MAG: sensor histidine kinase [Rudaea sp.]